MRLKRPDNRVFLGAGGSGKSTLARRQAATFSRVIVLDPNSEPENKRGARVIGSASELCYTLAQLGRAPFRICFRPGADPDADFDTLNRAAMIAGDVLVVWDEADLYMTAHAMPASARAIWNVGRHHGCRVFAIARRAAALSPHLRANVSAIHMFLTIDPDDAIWCGRLIGRERAMRLSTLGVGQCITWTPTAIRD